MVIMFDVDGVLADFLNGYTRLLRRMGGDHIPLIIDNQQATWDLDESVYPPDLQDRAWNYIKQPGNGFWYGLPSLLKLGQWNRFDQFYKNDDDVYFVTARVGKDARWQTEQWLRQYLWPNPQVIMSKAKGQIAKALGADYAIDDKAGNSVYGAYESPTTKWYLLDRPHNRFDPAVLGSKVRRVSTVGQYLDDIEAGK